MIDLTTLNERIKKNYKYDHALKIMCDPRTFKLDLDLLVSAENYRKRELISQAIHVELIYNWLHEHVTDLQYISNRALAGCGLHSFGRPMNSPHFGFITYLLIPNDEERMLFKLKFIDLIIA